jgi:hypothetical protein
LWDTTRMRKLYTWDTRLGPFYIAESNGRYHPIYEDNSLGSYATPRRAAEDLAHGYTFSISGGVDTANLGIPEDIDEWRILTATIRS